MEINLAIFLSGAGSTAKYLIEHLSHHPHLRTPLIVSNNEHFTFSHPALKEIHYYKKDQSLSMEILQTLQKHQIQGILLAGFLRKIPPVLIQAYPDKILNIHPALLPKFGGQGMYGLRVHQAVVAAKETESGCTVHLVNEHYDEGAILLQKKVPVLPHDTAEALQDRVKEIEKPAYLEAVLGYF